MKKKDFKGLRESEKKWKQVKKTEHSDKKEFLKRKEKQGNKRSPNSRELSWNTTHLTHWELHTERAHDVHETIN